jgi:hypothetical protein
MSYPDVDIHNSTNFIVRGEVKYLSRFCSNDEFWITPNTHWSHSRGVCLIYEIEVTVRTPSGDVPAKRYESSGTSYSKFAVIQVGPNEFEVTRRVTGTEDNPPADYQEPTEQQK